MQPIIKKPKVLFAKGLHLDYPALLVCLMLSFCLLGFTGCQGQNKVAVDQVVSPPDIPDPPMALEDVEENLTADIQRLGFADVIALEKEVLMAKQSDELTQRKLELVHAIEDALRKGVLTPTPLNQSAQESEGVVQPSNFNPDETVTYGDLYQWALGFQNPKLPELQEQLSEQATEIPKNKPKTALNTPDKDFKAIDLPATLSLGDTVLTKDSPLSREQFCVAYVYLNHLSGKAAAMDADTTLDISATANPAYALREFKDLEAVNRDTQPYVALAYKDQVLKTVFGLTPGRLTRGEGLSPKKPVTRAEAMRFLYQYYASH